MTKSRDLIAKRRQWTNEEDQFIATHYPDTPTAELCELLGVPVYVLHKRVERLGIKKSPGFMSSYVSGRFQRGQRVAPHTQFKPGQKPWSFGRKIGTHGRSGETQFKKGALPHNYVPVGTERVNAHGYILVKICDTGTQWERWAFKHRLTWQKTNGPIPEDHLVIFKDGNKQNCELDNLALISRKESVLKHGIASMPKELADLMKIKGAITRAINRRSNQIEQ